MRRKQVLAATLAGEQRCRKIPTWKVKTPINPATRSAKIHSAKTRLASIDEAHPLNTPARPTPANYR
jgi:hypothetical protein